jgi:hypothetical protein
MIGMQSPNVGETIEFRGNLAIAVSKVMFDSMPRGSNRRTATILN